MPSVVFLSGNEVGFVCEDDKDTVCEDCSGVEASVMVFFLVFERLSFVVWAEVPKVKAMMRKRLSVLFFYINWKEVCFYEGIDNSWGSNLIMPPTRWPDPNDDLNSEFTATLRNSAPRNFNVAS